MAGNHTAELWHDPHTNCGEPGPDGDIDADGHTDSADYSFILENLLKASTVCCCNSESTAIDTPRLSITVK